MSEPPNLLVFSDDWGRHPSSCQHLIRHLLEKYDVTWVNTIGMRPPRFDWQTVNRVREKMLHWLWTKKTDKDSNQSETPNEHIQVINPKMWPWFRSSFDRGINKRLLTRQLSKFCGQETIAITTIPIVADLMESLPVKRWLYYCVDDFAQWPGLDQTPMRNMERLVVERADTIVSVSKHLQEQLTKMGKESRLLPHGVDIDHWSSLKNDDELVDQLQPFEPPLCLFWGVVDQRIDPHFVRALSAKLNKGTILLVGPQQNPPQELFDLKNVHWIAPVSYQRLPALGSKADVLIMPYVDQPVTRAMQPLKMLEYLATGKPVVVRRLPATEDWNDCLDWAETPEDFATAVDCAIRRGVTFEQNKNRDRLANESWKAKAEIFESQIVGME